MKRLLCLASALLLSGFVLAVMKQAERPNVILIMADDLGWGDVGFNGNTRIKTPELDKMAGQSLQLARFYAAAPVCSPTRGSCLTGRNAERYGISFANVGHVKPGEITLAETLRDAGYRTGHFGKWHLGTLTQTVRDGHRGGRENDQYAPPWENGFDACFSTEQAVPTWDPMMDQPVSTRYWTGPGRFAADSLQGDDSRVIMDRVLPFVEKSVSDRRPFFSVIWFHTPHSPVVAGPEYLAMYPGLDENVRHYYGAITAMDEQIGRLRSTLRRLGVAENTLVFFASDNGPAGEGGGIAQHPGKRQQGTAGPFRGRKGSLYEGGIRVPALIEWPARFRKSRKITAPVCTSDYYPTILSLLGLPLPRRPLDGIDVMPLLSGRVKQRPSPIAFRSYKQRACMDHRFKIYSPDNGLHYEMYDLLNDPSETRDISGAQPGLLAGMKQFLDTWIASVEKSASGGDYSE